MNIIARQRIAVGLVCGGLALAAGFGQGVANAAPCAPHAPCGGGPHAVGPGGRGAPLAAGRFDRGGPQGAGWGDPGGPPPGWGQQGWGQPGWGQQGWGQPDWGQQGWGQPGWGQQGWGQPDWGQQGWGQPGWGQQPPCIPLQPPGSCLLAALGGMLTGQGLPGL
jgi:hypothetical protein